LLIVGTAVAAFVVYGPPRAVGEYGSVVFISGNMPMQTEIAPLLIVIRLTGTKT